MTTTTTATNRREVPVSEANRPDSRAPCEAIVAGSDAIETAITELIRDAPAIDPATADELVAGLRDQGDPLALAIARVVELVRAGTIDLGIALPPLAMACATLADRSLGDREREAARYEVETLLPVPRVLPHPIPDVSIDRVIDLSRGSRPRT